MYPGPVGQQTLFANYIISTRGVFFKTRGTDRDKKKFVRKRDRDFHIRIQVL